jgi:DNA-directed RNA polymerase specialized sigma24 family protein
MLHAPVGTIMSRLARAREKIRTALVEGETS